MDYTQFIGFSTISSPGNIRTHAIPKRLALSKAFELRNKDNNGICGFHGHYETTRNVSMASQDITIRYEMSLVLQWTSYEPMRGFSMVPFLTAEHYTRLFPIMFFIWFWRTIEYCANECPAYLIFGSVVVTNSESQNGTIPQDTYCRLLSFCYFQFVTSIWFDNIRTSWPDDNQQVNFRQSLSSSDWCQSDSSVLNYFLSISIM
jgi:hypothetical protein